MNIYYPDSKIPIGIWDGEAKIEYANKNIELRYVGEAPFGDFIYEINIEDYKFEKWIYARAMIFFSDRYAIFEAVDKDSYGPIDTVIIDLQELRYAFLGGWYNLPKKLDKKIVLSNAQNDELIIEDIKQLSWENLVNL